MREMKDSGVPWIGKIPADWEVRRVKYVAQCSNEKAPYAGQWYIGLENIESWAGKIVGVTETSSIESTVSSFSATSVLFAKLRPYLAKVALPYFSGQCSTELLVLSPTKIRREYLFWNLICSGFIETVSKSVFGAKMPRTDWDYIGGCFIPYPTMSQQRHIATYLDTKCAKIDAIIARQQQVIEKLKAYKLSVITEAVTKGLNPDVPMKDSGIEWVDEIPAHWENRKMLSILAMRVVDGPHESPVLFDTGIPYISATAIVDGKIDFNQMRGYISEEYCDVCDRRYTPQLDDILIVKLGASTGQVALVETTERFNIWVPLAAVRCGQDAIPRFIYYAFQSDYFIRQMEQSWTYGTQETLGVKTIERLRVLLPKLDEQIAIVYYLDQKCSAIRRLIKQKEVLVEKLTEYKKSLIYEVVTGKKEIA